VLGLGGRGLVRKRLAQGCCPRGTAMRSWQCRRKAKMGRRLRVDRS
jgi:hypothetical protein